MKKLLFLFVILISYLTTVGQTFPDSSENIFNRGRFTEWVRVSSLGSIPNDSIIGVTIAGVSFVRKDYRSRSFDAFSLGLIADGNNKAALLRRLVRHPAIEEIVFDGRTLNKILINDTVSIPSNVKLKFGKNVMLGGTGTITGGRIEGDYDSQLFDTTLTVKSPAVGEWHSLQWYCTKDTSLNNGTMVRRIMNYFDESGGGNLLITKRRFNIARGGNPAVMFNVPSNTRIIGMGYNSELKLHGGDIFNFRRMFYIGSSTKDIENFEIGNLNVNMSNPYTNYDSVNIHSGGVFPDAQNSVVFTYSSTNIVRNGYIHDIWGHDVTGDVIGISRNTMNIVVERIYQWNFLRQGISVGGIGVVGLDIKNIYDQGNTGGLKPGGNSFHIEPAEIVTDVKFTNSRVYDFSGSGTDGFYMSGVVLTGNNTCYINNSRNITLANNTFGESTIQIAPYGDVINVYGNTGTRLYMTTVSSFRTPKGSNIHNNYFYSKRSNASPIQIISLTGINIYDNTLIADSSDVISTSNTDTTNIYNNDILVRTGSNYGIAMASTTNGSLGKGYHYIRGNKIRSNYRGIYLSSVAAILGDNVIDAVNAKITRVGSYIKQFPTHDGSKNVLKYTSFPDYGNFELGDLIEVATSNSNEARSFVCVTAGGLYGRDWKSDTTYVSNSYVRDASNGRVYRSHTYGGQAIQPSTDVAGSSQYWALVSTTVAQFFPVDFVGLIQSGTGNPNGVKLGSPGNIYIRTDGPVDSVFWRKASGIKTTSNWVLMTFSGGGGGSGTVTSVGLTMPTGFTVGSSPVTSSGTIAVTTTLNGYLKGNGSNTITASSTIPYTDLSGVPNIWVQNKGKSVSDSIARVSANGDTLFIKGIAVLTGSGLSVAKSGGDSANIYTITRVAGFYTPTIGGISNYDAGSVNKVSYERNASNLGTISGVVTVDPTNSTTIQFYLTLPAGHTSNFTSTFDAWGTITADGAGATQIAGYVYADDTNDRIALSFTPTDNGTQEVHFVIKYEIK